MNDGRSVAGVASLAGRGSKGACVSTSDTRREGMRNKFDGLRMLLAGGRMMSARQRDSETSESGCHRRDGMEYRSRLIPGRNRDRQATHRTTVFVGRGFADRIEGRMSWIDEGDRQHECDDKGGRRRSKIRYLRFKDPKERIEERIDCFLGG